MVPPLPRFQAPKDIQETVEPEVSQETIAARKMFWAKFKKPKMTETMVMDGNTGETAETSQSSVVPASQPPNPILPETPPDAMGHRYEDYGMTGPTSGAPDMPASESVVAPVLPDASAVVPGENAAVDVATPSQNVSEALKRLTTVDLDNGAKPGALKQLQLGAPTSTAVWMTVAGTKTPVIINLTPKLCKEAGFELVSEAGLEPAEATTAKPSVAAPASTAPSTPAEATNPNKADVAKTSSEPPQVPAPPVEMPPPAAPAAPVPVHPVAPGSSTDRVQARMFYFR